MKEIYLRLITDEDVDKTLKQFPELRIMLGAYAIQDNNKEPTYQLPTLLWTEFKGNWTHQPIWDKDGYMLAEYDDIANKAITIDEYIKLNKTMIMLTQREMYSFLYTKHITGSDDLRAANIYASKNTVNEWRKQYE